MDSNQTNRGIKMNRHKDMELVKIWVTKEEKKIIEMAVNEFNPHMPHSFYDVFLEANKRGDFL
jgi:hypothetical protein